MKRFMMVLMVVAVVAAAGSSHAATATVNISANIVGTCQFTSVPTIAFGALDQTLGSDALAAPANLVFWCTKNAAYTLTDPTPSSDGSYVGSIGNGTDAIPVSITYTNYSGNGLGKTNTITSVLNATIANADYVNASAGNYNGSVVFTIAP